MDFEEFTKIMNNDEEDKSVNKDELDEIVKYINDNLERCSLEEEQREKKLYETNTKNWKSSFDKQSEDGCLSHCGVFYLSFKI